MGLTFRNVKGSALTIDELDDNFSYFTGSQSITGSLVVTGDEDVNGNLIVSGNITGTSSLAITASHALQADNATTASYTLTTPLAPTQTSVTASGTDITTTVVLEYGKVNLVYCDSSDYAVRLPEPILGGEVKVVNQGVADLSVFPYDTDDSVVGLTSGSAYILTSGSLMYTFECVKNPNVGNWSVISPYNGVSTKLTWTSPLMTVNSDSSGSSGTKYSSLAGRGIAASQANTIVDSSTNEGLYSEFNYTNGFENIVVDFAPFAAYTEVQLVEVRYKTNIPAMSPTSFYSGSPYPNDFATAAGFPFNQPPDIQIWGRTNWWNDDLFYKTPATNSVVENTNSGPDNAFYVNDWGYQISGSLSSPPASNTTLLPNTNFKAYSPTSTDPQNTSFTGTGYIPNRQQMYVNTGFGPYFGLGKWVKPWDKHGNQKAYLSMGAVAGNSTNPFSGYPAGFEFQVKVEMDFIAR